MEKKRGGRRAGAGRPRKKEVSETPRVKALRVKVRYKTPAKEIASRAGEISAIRGYFKRAMIDQDRVLDELAAIAFLDIRKLIRWDGVLVQETVNDEGGEVLVNKEIRSNTVLLTSSNLLEESVAHAVAEISQGAKGEIKLKPYNKMEALDKIGKYLGMWSDDKPPDKVTNNITNVLLKLETMSETEKMRRIATWIHEAAMKRDTTVEVVADVVVPGGDQSAPG